MKRLLIIAILAVAGSTAMAQTHQDKQQTSKEKTLYVIDGQVYSKDVFDKLAPDKIKDVKVLKGIGDAIVVTTRTGEMAGSSVLKIYGADEGAVEYSDPGNKDKTIVIGTKPDPKKAAKNTIVTRSIDQAIQALQQRKEELAGCNVEVKILPMALARRI